MTHNTTTPLSAALAYAYEYGPVLPLHTPVEKSTAYPAGCDCRRDHDEREVGKHPRTRNGLKDASRDPELIAHWWDLWPQANIGLDLAASGLVDIAPDSPEWQRKFLEQGMPKTHVFASGGGNGHTHHLYRRPDGLVTTRLCKPDQYDILSAGYAIMPPSLHQSGAHYLWVIDDVPLAMAPGWSCEMLRARPKGRTAETGERGSVQSGEELEELIDRLDQRAWSGTLIGVNGLPLDRSRGLVAIAGELAKAGASLATIIACLEERDAELGWNKYSDRSDRDIRYEQLALEALARAENEPLRVGEATRIYGTSSPHQTLGNGEVKSEKVVRVWSISDLKTRIAEETKWFCPGLVGPGLLTEIDGYAKDAGKSTFALSMTRCIVTGEPFLDKPTTQAKVVYCTEQSWNSIRPTIRKAGLEDLEDGLDVAFYGENRHLPWKEFVRQIAERAKDAGAGLLVIDTLAQWSGLRGDNENNSGTAIEILGPLQDAAHLYELGVLVVRHDRKSGGEVGHSGRGSSAYAGVVDVILHLSKYRAEDERPTAPTRQRLLEGTGRFEGETPERVVIELGVDEPYTYFVKGDEDTISAMTGNLALLTVIPKDPDQALTLKAIAEQTSLPVSTCNRRLVALVRDGAVVRVQEGKAYAYYQTQVRLDDDD